MDIIIFLYLIINECEAIFIVIVYVLTFFSIFLIILIYFISVLHSTRIDRKMDHDMQLDALYQEQSRLENEIAKQRELLYQVRVDNVVKLPIMVNEVLNVYDQSNIKIPADILEDITVITFENAKEEFDFIENQRYYWKLENTKKPFKKVKQ